MNEVKIELDQMTWELKKNKNKLETVIPKSQTNLQHSRLFDLIQKDTFFLTPMEVEEEEDQYRFIYTIRPDRKTWADVKKLKYHEKLRLLRNIGKLRVFLSSRATIFIHPENLLFDDNLMPEVICRGIHDIVPPFENNQDKLLKQYKCYVIACFSKKYTFDQLYHGALEQAGETELERNLKPLQTIEEVEAFLEEQYRKEQKEVDKRMRLVPFRRFRLFKQLSIIMAILSVLLAVPLIYYALLNNPFQDKQLEAHGDFLTNNYNQVISTLEGENPENFPRQTKYILAYSYIQVESLADNEKEAIMNNVSVNSNEDYLLYWIYNGQGELEESLEIAKFINDPQLIIYGLIQNIGQVQNNPDLTGEERDSELDRLQSELDQMIEDYELIPPEEEEASDEEGAAENGNTDDENNDE
ncbi:type VII secretion protein EssB [Oceanobacillus sp. CFH 90083]|uniref:type VII secretion protein EssB n=1 Tax=Oceanobacillus sp. CFH 90083 TaxID=2592336 RepID=UPI00128D8AF8|nr:type VII secretion protein EssB [Oceanobacillus sp. CFH 90083]